MIILFGDYYIMITIFQFKFVLNIVI